MNGSITSYSTSNGRQPKRKRSLIYLVAWLFPSTKTVENLVRVRDGGIACMGAFSKIVLYPADCCHSANWKIIVTASRKINKRLRILEAYVHWKTHTGDGKSMVCVDSNIGVGSVHLNDWVPQGNILGNGLGVDILAEYRRVVVLVGDVNG